MTKCTGAHGDFLGELAGVKRLASSNNPVKENIFFLFLNGQFKVVFIFLFY